MPRLAPRFDAPGYYARGDVRSAGAGAFCRTDALSRTTPPPVQQHALLPTHVVAATGGEQGRGSRVWSCSGSGLNSDIDSDLYSH